MRKKNTLLISLIFILSIFGNLQAQENTTNPFHSRYQSFIESYVRKGLPGLVMLIRTPQEGVWIGTAGMSRIEDQTPMQPHSLFHSASIAKVYTSVAIMMLRDEGWFSLDDKAELYLPDDICDNVSNARKATIRHLLNHSSGIVRIHDHDLLPTSYPEGHTWKKDLERIYGRPAYFEPGTDYRYSCTNQILLALIIKQVTGEDHAYFFTKRIIQPLGLKNTYYKNEAGMPSPPGIVDSYFDRYGDEVIENIG